MNALPFAHIALNKPACMFLDEEGQLFEIGPWKDGGELPGVEITASRGTSTQFVNRCLLDLEQVVEHIEGLECDQVAEVNRQVALTLLGVAMSALDDALANIAGNENEDLFTIDHRDKRSE